MRQIACDSSTVMCYYNKSFKLHQQAFTPKYMSSKFIQNLMAFLIISPNTTQSKWIWLFSQNTLLQPNQKLYTSQSVMFNVWYTLLTAPLYFICPVKESENKKMILQEEIKKFKMWRSLEFIFLIFWIINKAIWLSYLIIIMLFTILFVNKSNIFTDTAIVMSCKNHDNFFKQF